MPSTSSASHDSRNSRGHVTEPVAGVREIERSTSTGDTLPSDSGLANAVLPPIPSVEAPARSNPTLWRETIACYKSNLQHWRKDGFSEALPTSRWETTAREHIEKAKACGGFFGLVKRVAANIEFAAAKISGQVSNIFGHTSLALFSASFDAVANWVDRKDAELKKPDSIAAYFGKRIAATVCLIIPSFALGVCSLAGAGAAEGSAWIANRTSRAISGGR